MTHDTTLPDTSLLNTGTSTPPATVGLVIVWSSQAGQCGRVVLIPPLPAGRPYVFGRGEQTSTDGDPRLLPHEDRPGGECRATPLESPKISRRQLQLKLGASGELEVTNLGKAHLAHNDEVKHTASVLPGDTIQVGSQLLLLCVRRPAWLGTWPDSIARPRFGRPDCHGMAGESPIVWAMRRQLAFVASQQEHVLFFGESGTGKELLAKALHARSSRSTRALISRNASTFPETLIDAELFGNAKNYPNPGTPERAGLFGEASDSTLFLDEIAELPQALQTHLLRVLDHGEYQRLGETRARYANVRLVGATNRPELLRPDLAARFQVQIRSPGLDERREDIPFLVHVAMRAMAADKASAALTFFPDGNLDAEPRVSQALMRMLVQRRYATHFRELQALLWKSVGQSAGDTLQPVQDERAPAAPGITQTSSVDSDSTGMSREALQSALDRSNWVIERTWRELGLSSRHVLTRLIARHGLRRP